MENNKLSELLAGIRQDIRQPGELDDATRASVDARLAEAQAILAEAADNDEPLNDQVTRMASEFEAEHPKAARLLESVADTLSKLGI